MTTSQEQQGLPEAPLNSMTESTSFNSNEISLTIESDKAETSLLHPSPQFKHAAPIPVHERIAALDVVRGFALIGIFLMNIEFFNRSIHDLGDGMPQGLTGFNWLASFFVQYFIAGKFWTMFSLLFGMGFALMLTRANEKGQEFLKPYIRRVIALAIFGACHFIFLWPGDILFSYAATAVMLLVILFGKGKWIILAAIISGAIGLIPHLGFMGAFAGILLMAGVIILFIRYEKVVDFKIIKLPFLALIYVCIGTIFLLATAAMFFIPGMKDNVIPMLINGAVILIFGLLMGKYHQPPEHRTLRAGIGLYTSIFIMMVAFSAYQYLSPKDKDKGGELTTSVSVTTTTTTATTTTNKTTPESMSVSASTSGTTSATTTSEDSKVKFKLSSTVESPIESVVASAVASAVVSAVDGTAASKSDASANKAEENKAEENKTPVEIALAKKEERIKKRKEEREKEVKKEAETKANDIKTLTKGTYGQAVKMRLQEFKNHLSGNIAMAFNAIAMFLIGFWFVNIGIMKDTEAHLPLFKKMALWGLPIGIGMGMLGGLVATGVDPNNDNNGYMFAMGLQMLFNLPACMGYVGLLVWMLHTKWASALSLLAPFGRMALTNYLSQSLIASSVFYGYGGGLWGMGRAAQVGFVLGVVALQIMFSHLWLKYFRYGPMEWIWRAITYWKIPAMRY